MPDPTQRHKGHLEKFLEILQKSDIRREEEINKDLKQNICEFISKLPHNSPIRRDLLKQLTFGLSMKEVTEAFNISKRSYYRIMSEGNNFCINLKYAPGVKRERVDDDQIRMGENFFR